MTGELWAFWPLVLIGAGIGISAVVLVVAFELEGMIRRYQSGQRG